MLDWHVEHLLIISHLKMAEIQDLTQGRYISQVSLFGPAKLAEQHSFFSPFEALCFSF